MGRGRQPIRAKSFMSTTQPHHYDLLSQVLKKISSTSDFIHIFSWFNVYSRRSGADNPRRQNFHVNKNLLLLQSFASLHVSKTSHWSLILYFFFFHDFIHVYSPGAGGWQPVGDQILMSTGTSCHFGHLLQVSIKSLWSLILYNFFFHDLIHVYSPGAGVDSPQGTKFDGNKMTLSLYPFVASFKEISLKSDFIHFFHDLIHVYSPGAGVDSPHRGQNFDVNKKALSQRNLIEVWFYTIFFFHDLIHVYSPGAGVDSPQGTKFDGNKKALSLYPFVASFKEISLKSDFIHFFHDLIHVYSPGAGVDSPHREQNFDVNKKALSQRNLFEVWFYTFFFLCSWFNTCI